MYSVNAILLQFMQGKIHFSHPLYIAIVRIASDVFNLKYVWTRLKFVIYTISNFYSSWEFMQSLQQTLKSFEMLAIKPRITNVICIYKWRPWQLTGTHNNIVMYPLQGVFKNLTPKGMNRGFKICRITHVNK